MAKERQGKKKSELKPLPLDLKCSSLVRLSLRQLKLYKQTGFMQ